MAKRISDKNIGSIFTLYFTGNKSEGEHMLIYFHGNPQDLENCRVTFRSIEEGNEGEEFEWEAYRFNGRWVYGSSAEVLRSV